MHISKHYPVDNGDTTLFKLQNETTILIDCKIRSEEKNSSGHEIYDVKSDLLKTVSRRNKIPFVDMFILSHADWDHCMGFEKNFYYGNPDNYDDENYKEIMIDELVVNSLIFSDDLGNDDAKIIKKEAERRKKLYDKNDSSKSARGNRIIIMGYDEGKDLVNLPHYYPGDVIDTISGVKQELFSLFVHAPLKSDVVDGNADEDKNATSIVFQARFRSNARSEYPDGRFLLGGDADHFRFEKILELTEKNNNQESLMWDVFLAPHHCSWTFFNNVPYDDPEENKEPKKTSIKLIKEYQLPGGKIIASSKLIRDNADNPPHFPAKQEYIKYLGDEDDFISMAEYPKPSQTKPIIFKITSDGVKFLEKDMKKSSVKKAAAATVIAKTSLSSGNWCDEL